MQHFQGYLRSYENEGTRLEIRLFAGSIDPEPEDDPVTVIAIHEPLAPNEAVEALSQLMHEDAWLYLTQPDETTLTIESENGTEYQLSGKHVDGQSQPYGPEEWEWLARSTQQHATSLNDSLVSALNKLNRTIELIAEQQARIAIKSQGHPAGTTARTLYEQHGEFLARLRAAAEA